MRGIAVALFIMALALGDQYLLTLALVLWIYRRRGRGKAWRQR